MIDKKDQKSLRIIITLIFLIITITYAITIYAKGYRINLQNGISLKATGILSTTSKPKAASVYINDHLLTATDDTINLPPGEYEIKIAKDGYNTWQKRVNLKKENVYQTDTHLFRTIPDIRSITLSGAINPVLSYDGTKIIYAVASASASKNNGLYQYDLNNSLLPLNKNQPKLIATNFHGIDWSKFQFKFSPDSKELIASTKIGNLSYLINLDEPITYQNLKDITLNKEIIIENWQKIESNQVKTSLEKLPSVFKNIVSTESAKLSSLNTSETRFLYLAQNDYNLENNLITPPPGQSSQKQSREIKKDNYYVYDIKDDTNFLIGHKTEISFPFWLPDSNSIVFISKNGIQSIEYDSTNLNTLFSGKFLDNFIAPKLDGSEIIILNENLFGLNIR